jgi:hypothetical protein
MTCKYPLIVLIMIVGGAIIFYFYNENSIIAGKNQSASALNGEAAIEKLKQNGEYDSLASAVRAARYQIQTDRNELTAANFANDLDVSFSGDGIRLFVKQDDKLAQVPEIRWRLNSVGRGERQTEISGGEITSAENRIEVRRELYGLTEYFKNTPDGLEQGFIFNERPNTEMADEPLNLILQADGDYLASADADGQGLTFNAKNGGESLRYEKLKAWDADGTELAARMTVSGDGEIRLEVKDAAAKYPVTIDPTFVRTAKLTAADGAAGDEFGTSVAVFGDTAVVGAYRADIGGNSNQGAAYIFVRNGANWTLQQKITSNDGAAFDEFGSSVDISGETVVVGANRDDIGGNPDQGSAYVYIRNGANWTQQTKLISDDGAAQDYFGERVGISGESVIVGARFDDIGGVSDQGSAYIFARNGANWTQQTKLVANDGAATDYFGNSVAISGETVIVGASNDDIVPNGGQGSVYIFIRNGANWTLQIKLIANDGGAADHFGHSVDISGETVIVGARDDDVSTNSDQGSAYIYIRNGASWTLQQKLTANDGAAGDFFGYSVGISGNTLVIGAFLDVIGTNVAQGSAYIFIRNGVTWTQQAKLIANDGAGGNRFGNSVAILGETVVVGAFTANIGTNLSQGSAYIYRSVGGTWQSQKQIASDGATSDQFGFSVAVSNDTAVVGAPLDDTGAFTDAGAAYVFVKTGANWTQQSKLLSPDPGSNEKFGASVAISEDRIIIGAPEDNNGASIDQGAAYIFFRSGTNWIPQPKLTASDGLAFDNFGISVSISGNRAIVGAHRNNIGTNADQGSAYVFRESNPSWIQEAILTEADGAADDFFGYSVGISFDTAIVGAYGSDTPGITDRGAAYIFKRDTGATTWTQQDKLQNSSAGDNQGFNVAISGDTAVVGSPKRTVNGLTNAGRVYVYTRGTSTNWVSQSSFSPTDGAANAQFGYSVAIDEQLIAVGSPFSTVGGNSYQGAGYAFVRSGTTWTQLTKLIAGDGTPADQNGFGIGISGSTIITGANQDNVGGNSHQGSAYLFQANPSGKTPFDFDGDGKTDIGIFRPARGEWWINRSSTGVTFSAQFGLSTDQIAPVDFTGDGKADIALFRPSTGFWFILRSEDFSFYSFPFGAAGDIPAPADYDGDGTSDAAVFRPSTANWFILSSSGGTTIKTFGANGDQPVPADYDGDGKADLAIFRANAPNGAEWWHQKSSNGLTSALQFGISTDKAVVGDYTGDGKVDIAFFRPSTGFWFILRSEDFSFYSFPFGASGDIPAPGDYDGDGKSDAAVFRPSTPTWYLQRSTAGTSIQQFGASGDRPLPNAFVP